ncbi:Hypothetical protein BRZCDTV_503 [Brazilian cedratvirus IHUMI]|uniref:Uncharacterized protein n=1 Tax=Brazilian cedratvirus IHUMI TaxID=2126980 RepID=A0A2R8FFJ3_9VIRU|nr:Hypothetical protein BRZCDTV_503 [Brazilian cedratvirus IHUMI]
MSYTYNSATRTQGQGFVYPGSFQSNAQGAPVRRVYRATSVNGPYQDINIHRSTQGVIARNNYYAGNYNGGYQQSSSTSASTCPCARGRR